MEMINIDPSSSSQIAQIGHDGADKCFILFRRGGFYWHGDVDTEKFNKFRTAAKPGDFFREHIKGREPYGKISDEFVEGAVIPIVQATAPTVDPTEVTHAAPAQPEEQNQEVERVAEKSSLVVQNAKSMKVTDETTQVQANELLLAVASMRKQVADTFKPMKDAAFRTHRTICDQEKKVDNPLAEAEAALKKQIGDFIMEQRRIAKAAEDEARRIENERAQAEAIAESQRLAIEDAIQLEAQGDIKAAEAVLAAPAPAPVRYVAPAAVAPAVAQTSGVAMREDWDFRITNEELIPREYLLVNESAIRALGKTTKGKAKIAGVEFFPKAVVSASRGR